MDETTELPVKTAADIAQERMRRHYARLLSELARRGNTQEQLLSLGLATIDSVQQRLARFAQAMPLGFSQGQGVDMLFLVALWQVAMNAPMYGSPALSVQLDKAIDQLLEQAAFIRREVAPDGTATVTVAEQAPPPEGLSEAEEQALVTKHVRAIDAALAGASFDVVVSVAFNLVIHVAKRMQGVAGAPFDMHSFAAQLMAAWEPEDGDGLAAVEPVGRPN